MSLFQKLKGIGFAVAAAAMASPALANQQDLTKDEFYEFFNKVTEWTGGPLGMGLATTMLLMGGAIGVSKNSPMPALSGIGGAAFLHWGPGIIQGMMKSGAVI